MAKMINECLGFHIDINKHPSAFVSVPNFTSHPEEVPFDILFSPISVYSEAFTSTDLPEGSPKGSL